MLLYRLADLLAQIPDNAGPFEEFDLGAGRGQGTIGAIRNRGRSIYESL